MITIQLPDKFALTVEQVADLLSVDERTVRKYGKLATTDHRHLRMFAFGGEYRIELAELISYIKRNYQNVDI
ncbi:helix-turn-helix domain-containing protein [Adhaeribacter radiodurans]|uniref:Helix-turn-helix domain-containing protein n=1 Tax=Adhaeribacter radiodurans TaxID=2745197 RepID=A0A7L7LBP1_9BACT|nr:helix-turn-helix domain-containing protein [Adhaeribacter radiodurans]